ncbi:hypothetical protein GCM10020256_20480 [Streptomyces thermocoprophilus]
MDEHVTVVAQVADARLHTFASSRAPRGKGQRLEVTITDGSGRLQLVFFGNGVHKPHKELLPGTRAMFAGKVSVFNRRLQLAHPAYELLRGDSEETVENWAGALIPIYPATAKLESWKIGKAVQTVLPAAQDAVDPLPESLRSGRGLVTLPEALLKIHRPHTKADIADARARLKWDEAFVLQVALARRRYADSATARRAPPPPGPTASSPPSTTGCRSPSPTGSSGSARRSSTTSPVNTPCTGSSRERSAPARPSSRCAPCSPSSTPAGRPRCSPPPRSSPSSTTAPSPR